MDLTGAPAGAVLPGTALRMVRHGESTYNALELVQGQLDRPRLSRRGRDQARRLAERLTPRPPGLLISSDLGRAFETASLIAEVVDAPIVCDERLRERSMGALEGWPLRVVEVAHSGIAGQTVVDADARPPGGESLRELYARVADFLTNARTLDLAEDVVVVTHGGWIRTAGAFVAGHPPDAMPWPPVHNAAIFDLTRAPRASERLTT